MNLQLTRGRFIRRYKRFFADVELDSGEIVVTHCPNTGSMATLLHEGVEAYIAHSENPKRKLAWTLTLLGTPGGGQVMVNTQLANALVEEAVLADRIPELTGYGRVRREVPYGENSRIDLLLDEPRGGPRWGYGRCYVEVKSVTMASDREGRSDFPDSPTERGRKHLAELARLARQRIRVVQFFLVGRTDCQSAGIAAGIDPEYAVAVNAARAAGVELLAYRAHIEADEITVGQRCPLELPEDVLVAASVGRGKVPGRVTKRERA